MVPVGGITDSGRQRRLLGGVRGGVGELLPPGVGIVLCFRAVSRVYSECVCVKVTQGKAAGDFSFLTLDSLPVPAGIMSSGKQLPGPVLQIWALFFVAAAQRPRAACFSKALKFAPARLPVRGPSFPGALPGAPTSHLSHLHQFL